MRREGNGYVNQFQGVSTATLSSSVDSNATGRDWVATGEVDLEGIITTGSVENE